MNGKMKVAVMNGIGKMGFEERYSADQEQMKYL